MRYRIFFSKYAEKQFDVIVRTHRRLAERIAAAIDELADKPLLGILLAGPLKGLRKLRVGDYRIIYEVRSSQLIIHIIDIGHRREIYR